MRQGLATDREDAVMQAEKIFRNRDSEDYTSLRQTMNKVDAEVKVASASAAGQPQNLSQNQISEILEKNTKFLVSKIKEFQEKVASLEMEVAALKTKMTYQRPQPSVREITSREVPPVNEAPLRGQVKEVSKNHPRSGNYGEDDVSIEKFFYMGSK